MKRPRDFPGDLPAGAKVLTTRLAKKLPCPKIEPGSPIIGFFVEGRPVPWSAPLIARRGGRVKNKRLVAWQATIAAAAQESWGQNHGPYLGPVELELEFWLSRRGGRKPDTTNLQKAAEDALQGVVIANDSQVDCVHSVRRFDGGNGVYIFVRALGSQP